MADTTTIKVDGVTVGAGEVKALIDAGLPVGDSASYNGTVLTLTNATSTPDLALATVVSDDNGGTQQAEATTSTSSQVRSLSSRHCRRPWVHPTRSIS